MIRPPLRSSLRQTVSSFLVAVLAVPAPAPVSAAAQAASEPAAAPAAAGPWHVRLPYRSLARVKKLLDTIGVRVLLGYQPRSASEGAWKTADRPGVVTSRYFVKLDGGEARTVELAVLPYPGGGFELYLQTGLEGAGGDRPNPELPAIQAGIQDLIATLEREAEEEMNVPLDRRRLAFQPFQLSYIQSDRAMGLLKALGYTTIEYSSQDAESIYQKIYNPTQAGEWRLPVVVKVVDAKKTSLQDPSPIQEPQQFQQPVYSYGQQTAGLVTGKTLLPDLGGVYLHNDTSGEPPQRLLVAYDPDDVEPLEELLNLLRDKIDVPARQIVIHALVIEIQGDSSESLGIGWTVKGTDLGDYKSNYTIGVGSEEQKVDSPLSLLFGRVNAGDLFSFQSALKALVTTSKAKILSNPSVLVLDGRQAKIQIGNQIPVAATTVTTSTATESVTYFPVGIVLNLRPRVNEDNTQISMQVETIVSSVRATSATGSTKIEAPEVESRQVQTIVRVSNDTPFIIGGLTSNEEVKRRTGVPLLSGLPVIGPLFRRDTESSVRKEIIIVVTPHIVPQETGSFAYVIPQESDIFDSFGHQLFYNAFRIRHQDVFDLDFVYESPVWQSLQKCVENWCSTRAGEKWREPFASVLAGSVPGEEVLYRRMLWETVRKTDYIRFLDPSRMIYFEETARSSGAIRLANLGQKLKERPAAPGEAVVLTFDRRNEGSAERPFVQPIATLGYEPVEPSEYIERLTRGNRRNPDGRLERSTVVLIDEAPPGYRNPMDVLKGVLVLKRVMDLNPTLKLRAREFHAGRQIVFPTESDLRGSFHLIDRDAAKYFYEVMNYYPAFEQEFRHESRRIVEAIGGCAEWSASLALPPARSAESPAPRRTGASAAPASAPAAPREDRSVEPALPLRPSSVAGAPEPAARPVTERAPAPTGSRAEPKPAPARAERPAAAPPARAAVETPAPAEPPPPARTAPPRLEPAPAAPAVGGDTVSLPPAVVAELAGLESILAEAPEARREALRGHEQAARAAFARGDEAAGHLELGRFYLRARLNHAAVRSLKRAEELNPDSAEVHRAMVVAYVRFDDQKQARRHLSRAEELEGRRENRN